MTSNITFRFVLIFILLAGGAVCLLLMLNWRLVVALWMAAFFLIVGYFRFGTVLGALQALNKGDAPKAEELLKGTQKPEWLSKRYKAYYFFAKGLLAVYKGREKGPGSQVFFADAEAFFQKSLAIGLPAKQERAMTYLNLAHLAYYASDKAKVVEYLTATKENQTSDLRLRKSIEELEAAVISMND